MPPQIDYDALAQQHGGTAAPPAMDYDALAAAHGGDASPLPTFRETNAKDANGNAIVNSAKDFFGEATQGLNPVNIYHALKSIVMDLPGTVKQIGQAQGSLYQKAEESYQKGDYVAAARHMTDYLLPLIGPRLDQAGDFMQQGQYAKGLGATADIGAQMALPAVAGRVSAAARGVLRTNPNPAEASAVAFGEREGIPVDAGTKSGSPFVKAVQKRVAGTWGGAPTVEAAQRAQDTHLARVGGDLAADANAGGAPASPVSAGEGVRDALTKQIQDYHAEATTAYDSLRQMEAQRAQTIAQTGGVQAPPGAAKPFTTVPLAVDVSAAKAALKPLYDGLMREKELVGTLQGGKARTLVALDSLMRGPDLASLSDTDAALGNLKSMARTDGLPELRTQGQAGAAEAVKALDNQVRQAAIRGGPAVYKALTDGRAATVAKYDVANAMEMFGTDPASIEPARVYSALTANKDLALTKLRTVQRIAPDQVQTVARAYLEHAMDTATEAGGFAHADKLFADWQKLGPETKQILFPQQGQIQALDDFFLLAKKLKENPNPSGTATTLNATQLIAGIPGWAIAKMLYSPGGVRALSTGMRMSVNAAPAAKAAAVAQVVRAAQAVGIPLPVAAEDQGTPGAGR